MSPEERKKEEKEDKRSEKDEWLHQDQLALFDVLRERKEKKDQQEVFYKKENHSLKFEDFFSKIGFWVQIWILGR